MSFACVQLQLCLLVDLAQCIVTTGTTYLMLKQPLFEDIYNFVHTESNYKYAAFFNSPLEESQQHRWYAVFSVSLYHPAFIKVSELKEHTICETKILTDKFLSSSQNFRSELKATFPDVRFLESVQFVQLSGDMVELLIPSTDAQEQGYTVESDRHCQVCLYTYCSVFAVKFCHLYT